ncbi:MAG: hypothetical protein A2X08_12770 [Bacteroidetes bacterium GWA2_32_17]|nr:MAG: hypothetical protein A2X08_12770 [Bacteroidetes bacterium GWA2_32_17]
MNKKVLIITYYWPPSGGIGVHRCLKFAKYLNLYGWTPVIYTALNAHYSYLDETNNKDIPKGITILKHKIKEPFSAFKFLSGRQKNDSSNPVYARDKKQSITDKFAIWIRGNFFIPDARALWINPSVKYLSKYLKENHVDAILSDGPPHTNTIIACKLSKKFNIPWLADFQDPWTQVDYYKLFPLTRWADKKHRRLEQETFKIAKKITIVSPTWKNALESIGAKNVDVLYWGFDEEDFLDMIPIKNANEFVISHAGLLGVDRLPDNLFKVLAELKNELPDFAKKLKIKFTGMIDFSVLDCIDRFGLNENLEIIDLKRKGALQLTMDSDLLLLPLNKSDNIMGRIPGKLFEQLISRNPILVLGPYGSDVQYIVESVNAGKSFDYSETESVKFYIKQVFNKEISIMNSDLSEFSVKKQVEKLAFLLNLISIKPNL